MSYIKPSVSSFQSWLLTHDGQVRTGHKLRTAKSQLQKNGKKDLARPSTHVEIILEKISRIFKWCQEFKNFAKNFIRAALQKRNMDDKLRIVPINCSDPDLEQTVQEKDSFKNP